MPILTIDRRTIEVPAGTKVITAAERLGIMIPRFCFHPALGAVGACRVCAVKFVDGPVKGIQMSCMVEAQEGMVVATDDPEAVDFRRQVIEWLMVNHPHDCPVCDEGGHCLLQETTVSGGHGRRRYPGPKRTHYDQDLGPLLQHEMNRCIQCYRCSRFYQEYTGYRDLGVMGSAARLYFGRFQPGTLESPFTGNLADICPTGVFTDKPSRYFGRRWDYQRTPGVCIGCGLGCNTTVSVRYRRVARQEARFNAAVNGYFICDRGRHGYTYNDDDARPRSATVDGRPVEMAAALHDAGERLEAVSRRHGADAVAVWASPRASLESMAALLRLAEARQWRRPIFFSDDAEAQAIRHAVGNGAQGLPAVEAADFILLLGVDPLNEAPMLALAIRQAVRQGADVVAVDPRPISLPCDVEHFSSTVAELRTLIQRLATEKSTKGQAADTTAELFRRLKAAQKAVVVTGTAWLDGAAMAAGRSVARRCKAAWVPVLPAANSCAAAILGSGENHGRGLLEEIAAGRIKALVLVENDPFWNFPDRELLLRALDRLELLVVADYLPTTSAVRAYIFLPAATLYESGGTYINAEGRAQRVGIAHPGGIPIDRTNSGSHPPRRYDLARTESDPLPVWKICSELLPAAQPPEDALPWLARRYSILAPLAGDKVLPAEGLRLKVIAPSDEPPNEPSGETPAAVDGGWELLAAPVLFGGEELSFYSPQLRPLETVPVVVMAPESARELELGEGDRVRVDTGRGAIEAAIHLESRTAARTMIFPRHGRLAWQRMAATRQAIAPSDIKKV
jgi:NADH-quinone oxidoreductase subunit G